MVRRACLLVPAALAACAAVPTSVPGHLESHHHVRFQNGYVRVMETRLEPGETTLPHSHPVEAAVIFLTDGRMRIHDDDGTTREGTLQRDTVQFGSAAGVHRAENVGNRTVRVVSVEIFSQPPSPGPVTPASIGEVLLENDKVRLARVRLARGESAVLSGPLPVVVVAIDGGALVTGDASRRLAAGAVHWCEGGEVELRQEGPAAMQAILLTLLPRPGGPTEGAG